MPAGTTAAAVPDAVNVAYLAATNKRAWRTEARISSTDYVQLDATPSNAYDDAITPRTLTTYALHDAQGTRQSWFAAVEAQHAGGAMVQLLVGIDINNDGLPQAGEEVCRVGLEPFDNQRCLLDLRGNTDHPLWAFAHVIGPVGAGYSPAEYVTVSIATADFQLGHGGSTVSVAPGSDFAFAPSNKPAYVNFSYSPDVAHASSDPFEAIGGLLLTAADDAVSTATVWPLRVEFTPIARPGQSYAIASRSHRYEEVKVPLQPGETYYGLYADNDVPDVLDAVMLSPGVSVFGWREPFPASSVDSHLAQDAPPANTIGFTLWPDSLPGAPNHIRVCDSCIARLAVNHGRIRFKVRNENSFAVEARLRVRLSTAFEFSPPPPPGLNAASGNYYNPLRSGDGVFLDRYNQIQIFYWYTFDQNGQPVWYAASGEPNYENSALGAFNTTLFRIDRFGDGTRKATPVGRIVLTLASWDSLMFSWSIDGNSGTNRIQLAIVPRCTQQAASPPLNVTGHWYDLGAPGWGTNLLGLHNDVAEGLYFFDAQGAPRWVFGSLSVNNSAWSGAMYQFKGACPTCTYAAPTLKPVGNASLSFSNDSDATASYAITLAAPLRGGFTQNAAPIHRATSAVLCSNQP